MRCQTQSLPLPLSVKPLGASLLLSHIDKLANCRAGGSSLQSQRFAQNFDKCVPALPGDIRRAEVAPRGQPGTGVDDGKSALLGSAALRGDKGTQGVHHAGPGNLMNSPSSTMKVWLSVV